MYCMILTIWDLKKAKLKREQKDQYLSGVLGESGGMSTWSLGALKGSETLRVIL